MSEQKYWNEEIESLSLREVREIAWQKLEKQMRYVYDSSEFYRNKFKQAGAEPEDIHSIDEFRKLPVFLTKDEDRDSQQESLRRYGHPYGLNLCCPVEKVLCVNSTSGTTGVPTFYSFTEHDVQVQNESFARGYWQTGIRPGDTVLHATGQSMWLGGTSVMRGLQAMGARVIPVGAESGATRILQYANLTRPTAMIATPSIAEHLIDKCQDVLGKPVSELGINRIVVLGEPGAGLPEVRQRIESAYNCRLYDGASGIWGLHSVSCDTDEYQGLHLVCEDMMFYWDLVDPQTKEPLEITNGAMGEAVITALDWEAAPSFRYAFGDLVQVFTEPCPECGFQWTRLRIYGRTDDVLNVKGVKVYPSAVKNVIDYFIPKVTGEFRIVLEQQPPRVEPPLKIKVEHGQELKDGDLPNLKQEIQKRMSSQLSVSPEITLVQPNSLEKDPSKKRQFFEKRY